MGGGAKRTNNRSGKRRKCHTKHSSVVAEISKLAYIRLYYTIGAPHFLLHLWGMTYYIRNAISYE